MLRIAGPVSLAALVLALVAASAFAHGDEDHGGDAKNATSAAAAIGAAGSFAAPQRLADGSLFVPKSVQRELGLRTRLTRVADLKATIELNGQIVPDPETSGLVQAVFAGRVMPGPKGMPTAGRRVAKGEVLAYLRPINGAIERANQQASAAELDAQLAVAESKVKRFDQLEGAVPHKEIDAARIEFASLQKRRAYVKASVDSAEALVAPASGVLSGSRQLLAGQIVDAKETLFEIVDPARLAVEALAYDVGIAKTIIAASAVAEETPLELKFVGGGAQLREQALPLFFRISSRDAPVAAGQPVKVIAQTDRGLKGVAVPRAALTKNGNGEMAVWVHAEGERFVARRVRAQSLDAANVAVLDGLNDGERVVIAGANLLSQIR